MKNIIKMFFFTATLLVASLLSYSQVSMYGGFWAGDSKLKPYVFIGTGDHQAIGFSYQPILGFGYNSMNKLSGMIGFDTQFGYDNVQPVLGFGMELFGYENVYQDFMPNFRAGIKYKRFRLLSSIKWSFTEVQTKLGPAAKSFSQLTYGIFYDIK